MRVTFDYVRPSGRIMPVMQVIEARRGAPGGGLTSSSITNMRRRHRASSNDRLIIEFAGPLSQHRLRLEPEFLVTVSARGFRTGSGEPTSHLLPPGRVLMITREARKMKLRTDEKTADLGRAIAHDPQDPTPAVGPG